MTDQTIQTLLAPVVMISACGLLCLALYNRLAVVVGRLRQFHHERVELHTRLLEVEGAAHGALQQRFDALEHQAHQLLSRARLVRNGLLCLVGCILSMIACSLLIGLSLKVAALYGVAVAMFVLGLLVMSAGVICAIWELSVSLRQVQAEHEHLEHLAPAVAGAPHAGTPLLATE